MEKIKLVDYDAARLLLLNAGSVKKAIEINHS